MITKINKVKDFGILKNFNGSSLPEFKTFNLIYGWNYSGKTTLSRVFRCLEKGAVHQDYTAATFELANQTGNYDSTFAVKPNIRVFNSDFIKENLKWDDDNIEPIFLLGAENIELQKELAEKEKAFIKSQEELEELKRLKLEKQGRINSAMTNKARDVGSLLGIRPFDSRHFTPIVERTKANPITLNQTDFDNYKAQAISTEQKPNIGELNLTIKNLQNLNAEVENILHKQAASGEKIQKLLDDATLSSWVEKGKTLHEGKLTCEFCGNQIPSSLLESLNKHFSKDFEQLKNDIQAKIQSIISIKIVLTNILPAEIVFYSNMQPDYRTHKPVLEVAIQVYNKALDSLIADLKTKLDKPFDKLEITPYVDNTVEIQAAITNINVDINKNDKRTADFSTEKDAAIQKMKEHFAAEFEVTETYSATQTQLIAEQQVIDTKAEGIEIQKKEIVDIKKKLDETVKGASKVNDYLKIFFGKDDVQIESTPDKRFKLVRGSVVAKNLSEGEKTAISFAYFTAKLEEQNNKLSETIVYIDDPISSLDSNHLFNIYSFIRNTFYENTKDTNGGNLHIAKCKQLFISTHNFEFYNLIYDWFSKTRKTQTPQAYYTVERVRNSHADEAVLKESNQLIQKYKSEYVYLFSIIYGFHQAPADTFENLYHLPNILRKFVETYLNFKFLSSVNIEESIDELIKNPVECERARKFMHYYSHSLTTDKFMKFADLAECTDVVKIVIEAVKKNDPIHFKSLVEAVTL